MIASTEPPFLASLLCESDPFQSARIWYNPENSFLLGEAVRSEGLGAVLVCGRKLKERPMIRKAETLAMTVLLVGLCCTRGHGQERHFFSILQ